MHVSEAHGEGEEQKELASRSDPRITARYYRQIDDTKKKEALAKIPVF